MQLKHHKEQQQFQHSMSEQHWRSVFGHVLDFPHHEPDEGDFVDFAKAGVLEVIEAFFVLPWDNHNDYLFAYAFPTKVGELHKIQYP